MAFIKIISLDGGDKASCSKYYFKDGRINEKNWIAVGEVTEVPDSELGQHLATGKVMQVMGESDEPRRRGRPAKMTDEASEILAIQR